MKTSKKINEVQAWLNAVGNEKITDFFQNSEIETIIEFNQKLDRDQLYRSEIDN